MKRVCGYWGEGTPGAMGGPRRLVRNPKGQQINTFMRGLSMSYQVITPHPMNGESALADRQAAQ